MSYDIALNSCPEFDCSIYEDLIEPEETKTAEDESFMKLNIDSREYSRLLDEIYYSESYPEYAAEGIVASIYDLVTTAIRTASRFIADVATWFAKKIKSIVSFRKSQKSYRDKKYNSLISIWNGLTAPMRVKANESFQAMSLEYSPTFEGYREMCLSFSTLLKALDENVNVYVSKDIATFGAESDSTKKNPSWITALYEDITSREALLSFGIKYTDGTFESHSPFRTFPNMDLGSLNFKSIEQVRLIDADYQMHCWKNLKIVLQLKDRFEQFNRDLQDKGRAIKRDAGKMDKKDVILSCKSVIASTTLASRLVSYLTGIEEALDVRRGWLIDKAIKACSESTTPTVTS